MNETDADLLPLSALQHFAYCPRQFALIHLEQIWEENRFTAEGQLLHQRVNSGETETRGDLHVARTLRLVSHELGLTGVADAVEFHRTETGGAKLPGFCTRLVSGRDNQRIPERQSVALLDFRCTENGCGSDRLDQTPLSSSLG